MRYSKYLNKILGSKLKLEILRYLINANQSYSGREISRYIGFSHVSTISALKELEYEGIILTRKVGTSILFGINDKSYMYDEILKPLFEREEFALDEMLSVIVRGVKSRKPLSVILFGSVMRGEEEAGSDVDILIVCAKPSQKKYLDDSIFKIGDKLSERFGNSLSPIIWSQKEFRQNFKIGTGLSSELKKRCKVIYGKDIRELL
jgi:predicted nucleotidyltransferase